VGDGASNGWVDFLDGASRLVGCDFTDSSDPDWAGACFCSRLPLPNAMHASLREGGGWLVPRGGVFGGMSIGSRRGLPPSPKRFVSSNRQ